MRLAINGGKPIRKNLLVFGSPQILNPEIREIIDSLKSGWIGLGPKTQKFEEEFKKYIGSKYAIATNSCTAALHLSLLALEIGEGDEVITTPMTFGATANVILHVGAIPVFVDIDRETLNINPKKIEEKINEKTRAIIPVHLYGRPCEMNKIMEFKGLAVIEDAAHAIEAVYKGKKIGTIGDTTCFSFYVTKNLTTAEGGVITTNNRELAKRLKIMRLHGQSKSAWKRKAIEDYEIVYPGFKYNMTDLQASLGLHQLKRIEKNWKKRKKIWKQYNKAFSGLPLETPKKVSSSSKHAMHLYTPLLDLEELKVSRNKIREALYKEGIGTGIHYKSLHLHKFYRERFNFKPNDFPIAKFVSNRTISLPFSPKLTRKDVGDVIEAMQKVLSYYQR